MASKPTASEPTAVVPTERRGLRLSVDWWAVLTALVLAGLLLVGVIPNVPW